MTEINHNLVKQQIVDILQASSSVYDVDDDTKFIYLEVGEPPGNPDPTPPTYPALWVTNARNLETITRKGINITSSDPQTKHAFLLHEVTYQLKMMVVDSDSVAAEKQLDTLQKIVMETLEADTGLTGGSQTLPVKPDDSWPERVETFRAHLDGQGIRGKVITWHLQFTTT